MPIYSGKTGKMVSDISINESADILNEGLFDKNPPASYVDFALKFYEKLSKKVDVIDMGREKENPKKYISNNEKWKYEFKIDHENYDPEIGYIRKGAKTAAAQATGFIIPGVGTSMTVKNAVANAINSEKYRKDLEKVIASIPGMKGGKGGYYYHVDSGKKYVYAAWVDVRTEDDDLIKHSILLTCLDYKKWKKKLGINEAATESEIPGFDDAAKDPDGKLDLSSIFAGFESEDKPVIPAEELKNYQPYPDLKKAFNEHFDILDDYTRKTLMTMNEAEHNTALTALTSKLYDQIVSKAHNIDFGEIPKTKGDITKLSNYETLKETLGIIKGIVTEYKQDTKCIDEVSVAMTNIQGRKDMFERAFRGNCEMPMLMYDNMVMAVVVGTSYLITACIEFIKAPRDESFTIQLDKVAYNKSKDHLIYTSISKFNHMCENGDFDQAMNMIIDKKIRKFTGITIAGGIAVGVIILTNIIPLLRELVYLFYHTRVTLSDFYETQADLLTMNAYNLQHNDVRTNQDDKNEIIEKQNKIAEKFRKAANFFAIKNKKAEIAATKDIENSAKKYKLDADANIVSDEPDESDSGSALF